MARTRTEMDDDGRIVTHKVSRSQRKSEQRLIPWTEGPKNWRQRAARNLWG